MGTSERFNNKFPHGRIAQTVEGKAAEGFGPEQLTKSALADTLNIPESAISDREWADISEFAVNAGASLIQTMIAKDVPETPSGKDVRTLRKRVKSNEGDIFPIHDLFHAAETYRLTQGKEAAARFAEVDSRQRYIDPETFSAELYPVLFGAIPGKGLIPVLLCSHEGRKVLKEFSEKRGLPEAERETIVRVLSDDRELNPEERQKQYEAILENLIIGNAQMKVTDLTPDEIDAARKNFEEILKNPPPHYASFAARVFREEWKSNPRLFFDELLECIRTKPELHPLQ